MLGVEQTLSLLSLLEEDQKKKNGISNNFDYLQKWPLKKSFFV